MRNTNSHDVRAQERNTIVQRRKSRHASTGSNSAKPNRTSSNFRPRSYLPQKDKQFSNERPNFSRANSLKRSTSAFPSEPKHGRISFTGSDAEDVRNTPLRNISFQSRRPSLGFSRSSTKVSREQQIHAAFSGVFSISIALSLLVFMVKLFNGSYQPGILELDASLTLLGSNHSQASAFDCKSQQQGSHEFVWSIDSSIHSFFFRDSCIL